MKKIISLMLATILIVCLAMTSVFAEDKVIRLSPDNATILPGSVSQDVPFDMGAVGEPTLGLSVQLSNAVGDSSVKILGQVDLSLYREITITYSNDGPTAAPAIDAQNQTMLLKVNDTVVGVKQVMTGAPGWTSADVVALTFPISSALKGEVVIFVGNACVHGIAFFEATFVEKAATIATAAATVASTGTTTATAMTSATSASTSTKAPNLVKTSAPTTATAGPSTKNVGISPLVPIIIGSVVVLAGATVAIILIKKKNV